MSTHSCLHRVPGRPPGPHVEHISTMRLRGGRPQPVTPQDGLMRTSFIILPPHAHSSSSLRPISGSLKEPGQPRLKALLHESFGCGHPAPYLLRDLVAQAARVPGGAAVAGSPPTRSPARWPVEDAPTPRPPAFPPGSQARGKLLLPEPQVSAL